MGPSREHDTSETTSSTGDTVVSPRAPTLTSDINSELARDIEGQLNHKLRRQQTIGQGGMGEVIRCRDLNVRRDVALKTIRREARGRTDLIARFVREARVQGQLEHPSIVPVYEMGRDDDDVPYFVMQLLRGATMRAVLLDQQDAEQSTPRKHAHRRLLTDFLNVCQAIDFAHSKGVIHRDLKPENVMLGEFGAVYVIDWGLAKVIGVDDDDPAPVSSSPGSAANASETVAGDVMGTPGYMAPEQLTGVSQSVQLDIYALGSILFEILTLQPLHPGDDVTEVIESTLDGADARACRRAPERGIAPELEAICVRATRTDPKLRYQSVHDFIVDLERYLDGDRDLERRLELSEEHAENARQSFRLLQDGDDGARVLALQEAGRALALNPLNQAASELVVQLIAEPPRDTPPEVQRVLEHEWFESAKFQSRQGAVGYAALLIFVPLMAFMGIRNGWIVLGLALTSLVGSAWAYRYSRTGGSFRARLYVSLVVSGVSIMLVSQIVGPLVLVPSWAMGVSIMLTLLQRHGSRLVISGACVFAMLAPLAFAYLEWWPETYRFTTEGMLILPNAVELPKAATLLTLMLTSAVMVFASAGLIGRFVDRLAEAERKVQLQAWQLRNLVPREPTR